MAKTGEEQYFELGNRIIDHGIWIENDRTGKRCKTVINYDFEYECSTNVVPLLTSKKSYYKSAIAEMTGYLLGYSSAADFRSLGCNTWNANANENESWLNNPNRKGEDDMGFVYGAVARSFPKVGGGSVDLLEKIISNLSKGYDDRGEILTFYHPGAFELGCLRPCMFQHQFSVLGDELYLNSYQRSCDVPLGLGFNMIQVVFLLRIIAQITGLKPAKAFHKIVNAHVYEDQMELFEEQMTRSLFDPPELIISKNINSLESLKNINVKDENQFKLINYKHHPEIKFPFSV